MKILITLLSLFIVNTAVAGYIHHQNVPNRPEASIEKLVAKIQTIPAQKWRKRQHEEVFYLQKGRVNVGVSMLGNLYIRWSYVFIPRKLKMELRRFWEKLNCYYYSRAPIESLLRGLEREGL